MGEGPVLHRTANSWRNVAEAQSKLAPPAGFRPPVTRCAASHRSAALPAWAEPVSVPSGQKLELLEAFWDGADETSRTLRLRFLAPQIGGARSFADVEADFLHLCRAHGLPRVPPGRQHSLVVVNMSDRPVPFGTSDPEAVQYFEAFRIESGDCVWEGL